ncbi:MAG: sigma-54 dependent transcriptional regulator [candidate division WOR-3 bacterium]|nr:sigma-54 dependent transcriptional regulator [candidate division WOR-3 bacterium]
MAVRQRILVVDDDVKVRALLGEMLTEQGYEVVSAADGTEALQRVDENDLSLVLLDFQLPDFDGLKVLEEIRKRRPALPVVMVSGFGTIKLAVEATKGGAYDFIEKPPDPNRVALVIKNALAQDALRREVETLRAETLGRYQMVGTSAPMQRLYEMIDRVAPSKASVLILGESGTGKELAAHAVHQKSPVASGPFVRINCAAIPHDLIESELFGHEKGAFTGAVAQKPGKLELADKGTVLLDEIGDMDFHVQAKLLRFLQEGEFERVGGTKTLKVDVRTFAATNKNLEEEIKAKRFREDLYYRLDVVTLKVPPLRERKEDIPALAEHFLRKYCAEHGVPLKAMTDDAMGLLAEQPWPGNVREFANVIQRLVVLLPQQTLSARDIRPLIVTEGSPEQSASNGQSLKTARDEFERKHILRVLADCQGNMTEAARILDIDRTTLYRTLERLGVKAANS